MRRSLECKRAEMDKMRAPAGDARHWHGDAALIASKLRSTHDEVTARCGAIVEAL
jgi:hypothetical protein